MRAFAAKTEIVTTTGQHIRYVPAAMAAAMVSSGHAAIHNGNGKVKAIRLTQPATTHGRMIGPASDGWMTPKFTRRVRSDDHRLVWWEHHPRATY